MARVTEALRNRIVTAKLAPGTHLHQAEIAKEYGVSRIPIRDALQTLAGEGLVDLKPGGATVSLMSAGDLDELYELRGMIEPKTTALGVLALGRLEIRQMRDLHLQMMETKDPLLWLDANVRFHRTIYARSGRPRSINLIELLRSQTDRYLHLHLTVIDDGQHLHAEHEAILEAVEARDGAAVEELTRRHLQSSHDFILEYLINSAVPAEATV